MTEIAKALSARRKADLTPVVVDVAEQQVATFLPPNRPFGWAELAAEPVGEMPNWLGCGNDLVQLGCQFLDPRRDLSPSDPARHIETPNCDSRA